MSNDMVKKIIKSIVYNGLKEGKNQCFENSININNLSNKKYPKVDHGVYLSDQIATAEGYAGTVKYESKEYKIAFMCRVCPKKVRIPSSQIDYFVVDPNDDCVRPYRILLKER